MTDLSWRDTHPDDPLFQPGTALTLERARENEPEIIGSVRRYLRPGLVEAWSWSLSCHLGPLVDFPRPGFETSGYLDTQREARNALVAAWRMEEAYRAEVRESPIFDSLSPYVREYVTTGQPVPAKWSRAYIPHGGMPSQCLRSARNVLSPVHSCL